MNTCSVQELTNLCDGKDEIIYLGPRWTVGTRVSASTLVGVPIEVSAFFPAHHAPSVRYYLIALMIHESVPVIGAKLREH